MCVSIGLTIGKVPTVGVAYNPILNEVLSFFHFFVFPMYLDLIIIL